MNIVAIGASLVPATRADLFSAEGAIIESRTVFVKSRRDGRFSGPHFLENHFLDEIVCLIDANFYYVIGVGRGSNPQEFGCELLLRPALWEDFYWSPRFLRFQRMYYLMPKKGEIWGPYLLDNKTDIGQLQSQVQMGMVLVPNEKQTFQPLAKRLAS